MTKLDSILKSRDITLPTKVHLVKAMVFPVLKEMQPVHPKGNQSWIFIGRTDAEVETSILWPPDAKNWFTWKDPGAGEDWKQRRRGWQRMRWLDGITNSMDMSLSKLWSWWWTGKSGMLQSMGLQRVGHAWETELNWTRLDPQLDLPSSCRRWE